MMTQTARLLLSEKQITEEQYEQAYLEFMERGGTMGFHLVAAGAISSENLVAFIEKHFGLRRRSRPMLETIPAHLVRRISRATALRHRVLPISIRQSALQLGVADPCDSATLDEIARLAGMPVSPVLISEDDMSWAIARYYPEATDDSRRDTPPFSLLDADKGLWHPHAEDGDDEEGRRHTISWGITIEDALASAVADAPRESTPPVQETVPPIALTVRLDPPATDEPPVLPPAEDTSSSLHSWTDNRPSTPAPRQSTPPSEPPRRHSLFPQGAQKSRTSIPLPGGARNRTEGELLQAVATTKSRDEIIILALEYMLRFSKRAVFLVTRQSEIRGFHVAGEYTNRESIRSFWIPFSARSTLGVVARSGQMHLGPIGSKPADAVFCAALGGSKGAALMIPIVIAQRTAGILFADGIETHEIAWPRLTKLLEAVTGSLSRLLLKSKTQDDGGGSVSPQMGIDTSNRVP